MIALGLAPGSADRPNEDWVGATAESIVVLDGLSAPRGVGGCRHGTPWYVSRLGPRLLTWASDLDVDLGEALARAISDVAALHPDCDLTDPGTPSSTVAVARRRGAHLEGLVLADSPVLVEAAGRVDVLTDPRVNEVAQPEAEAALSAPAGTERDRRVADLVDVQRRVRNRPGGYWIAQADPVAAAHAVTQSWAMANVTRVAVMSDGASRLVDTYHRTSWNGLLDLLGSRGPLGVLEETRACEAEDPDGHRWPRYKARDDAAVAYWDLRPLD